MFGLSRALIPAIALGLGTWLGMGRPDARAALAAGKRVIASIRGAAHDLSAAGARKPPPLESQPEPVDASNIPDPLPPWPRLNPDEKVDRAWFLSEGPAHAPGDGRRLVTFTFDDGPFPETAPTVLRILEQHHIRATFFFIGQYLVGNDRHAAETRMWARRIADEGHYVGNHTMDHKELTALPRAAAIAEIDESQTAIERATGQRPLLFRPPYGSMNQFLESALRDRHLDLMLWNIDIEDMKKQDPDTMVEDLKSQLEYKGGGVVLLHDMHWPSVKAFNRLVRWLEAGQWDESHPDRPGWVIVDLPEYLRETAKSPQPYATREDLDKVRRASSERRAHAGGHARALTQSDGDSP